MEKQGVLKGLRVVDFGQYIAGPLAAMILGDYGAEVIHIDPPGGPRWDGYKANAVLARGKKNIILDLKDDKDLAAAKKLAATADILIENFRPGVMDRLGLGYEACAAENPTLIYCSLPGFSRYDPERRDLPGWEGIVGAEAGLYSGMDFASRSRYIRFDALPLASNFAAVIACHSIVSALIVREKCGRGQFIESSLYDACFEIDSTRTVTPPQSMLPPGTERRKENSTSYALVRLMAQYPCKDGRYIQTTPPPRGALSIARALFPADWIDGEVPADAGETVRKLMLERTMQEWEDYAQSVHGAGFAVSKTSAEWLRDKAAVDSRSVIPVEDPILGRTMQPGVPSIMLKSGDSAGIPRHLPDADRAEILAELDTLAPRPVPGSCGPAEPALKGIKVLDLCQVVAGPTCGRLLAEYGAEVLKINNPRLTENHTALAGHETQNNGKTCVFLDLKSPEGKTLMDRFIREADIFHCNFAQAAYEHLGVTEEELREKNPSIILSQINIHSLGGGREAMRGHEDLGEAATGMSCRYGGSVKPETLPLLVLDHMTGQMGCLGVMLAVYGRMRTGVAQRVQACLSRSSGLAQLPFMLDYDGKAWDEPAGPEATGYGPLDRIFKAKDGWFYLVAKDTAAIRSIPLLSGLPEEPEALSAALEARAAEGTAEAWVRLLDVPGVAVRRCRFYQVEPPEEEYAKARGITKREYHPGVGMLRTTHGAPRLSLTPTVSVYPSPAPGGDTERFMEKCRRDGLI
jgi:crotonobetainyl-CoA:carnitine CoA-transferase CaiB-like acyl-CoA transferase